ncbi:MAG: hypothetical protein GY881_06765 [Gammaproteobacteria bacterium]|nr:hypothetical protein [Gammaproteobacteria bacterium]
MNIDTISSAYSVQTVLQRQAMARVMLNRQVQERQAIKQAQAQQVPAKPLVAPAGQAIEKKQLLPEQASKVNQRFHTAHIHHQDVNLTSARTGRVDLLHKQAQTDYQAIGKQTVHMMIEQIV